MDFYSGNSVPEPNIPNGGLLENYYSWTWGDALYVVLDDYWYTVNAGGSLEADISSPQWNCSFGYNQFMWLKNVLSTSNA